MFVALLSGKYNQKNAEGWGAFQIGNLDRAEEHFREVLKSEDDPKMGALDLADAHNGIAAVNFAHKDFFEAARWYQEASYILDKYYGDRWPKKLDWAKKEDRPAMRALAGMGHLNYHNGRTDKAQELYKKLRRMDKDNDLGMDDYLDAIKKGKKFEEM